MKADQKLADLGITFDTVEQDNPTEGCREAAKERGLEPNHIVKSLIIESEGEKIHVLLPGDRKLSESKLGSEYRMVSPEKSKSITGFESGTVHPFSTELRHVVDKRIFDNRVVSHTNGERDKGLIIHSNDFKEALDRADFKFDIMDVAVSNEDDYERIQNKGLEIEDAKFVVDNGYGTLFTDLVESFRPGKVLDLIRAMHRNSLDIEEDVATEVLDRARNQTHIQNMVEHFSKEGSLPEETEHDLEEEIEIALDRNQDAVEDFINGKDSALNYLVGQVMQRTKGKFNPGMVQQILEEN
ncbi:MAG: hypothetical protein J07AB43_16540 [Candidatus Nanosalina sp. J07AB43]|nr:MAG: hypothetical protein J07AB43_16540 [Candidatus Nanosalina sp. J07AB43]